ncbi:MAG: arsinothricin resistance N-acetyltransferase ArsN1 family B [Candidatus Melainabacteria bacterium]|nr:arsinothricin resistance N-acetyltransferase ArsN1 family B [Candidatus Melainabacteria bacterium]
MIRQATADDAAAILKIYAPYCTDTVISFESASPSVDEMKARIEKCNATHLWIVDEEADGIFAYAYAGPHRDREAYRWSVDTSVYVDGAKRRTGLGTKLYTRLVVELRERGFYNAFAGVTLPNQASVNLHEKLGFRPVGIFHNVGYKMGKWHDVGWWHLVLKDHDQDPAEPTTRSLLI